MTEPTELQISFDFATEGEALADPFLDTYELHIMFEQTEADLRGSITRRLQQMRCPEHGAAPRIHITGRYDNEAEELDVRYHVDACCKLFTLRVIQALNKRA